MNLWTEEGWRGFIKNHWHSALDLVGIFVVVVVGVADYHISSEVNLYVIYLLLISVAGWFGSRKWNRWVTAACALAWAIGEARLGFAGSHPMVVVWSYLVHPGFFFIFNHVLWRLKHDMEKERQTARRDFLTGLLNRRGFLETASGELHNRKNGWRTISLAYMDVDHFKHVNDQFGHVAGDAVLSRLADIFRAHLRPTDTPARLGGDEFAVLMPHTEARSARKLVSTLQDRLVDAMRDTQWPVTLSIGVVEFRKPPASVQEMMQRGDDCMYRAKNAGRNRIAFEFPFGLRDVTPPGSENIPCR